MKNTASTVLGAAKAAERHFPIAELGVIGDRRTAAVIGPDGTVLWLCLPDYDSRPVFGRLLDSERGGYWRLGPATGTATRAISPTPMFSLLFGRAARETSS